MLKCPEYQNQANIGITPVISSITKGASRTMTLTYMFNSVTSVPSEICLSVKMSKPVWRSVNLPKTPA